MQKTWMVNIGLLVMAVLIAMALGGAIRRKGVIAAVPGWAGNILIVAADGVPENDQRPFYLLDTASQTLVVYEFNPQTNTFRLDAARRVLDDLQITEYHNTGGPTVRAIKEQVDKIKGR